MRFLLSVIVFAKAVRPYGPAKHTRLHGPLQSRRSPRPSGAVVAALAAFWAACSPLCGTLAGSTAVAAAAELRLFEQPERHMGTLVLIQLYAPDEATARRALAAAFARVAQLDRILSDYDPESELSRLSAAAPTSAPRPVGDDLWKTLLAAQAMSRASDGAFDVTVGPLTKLWRRARRQQALPSAERLAEARAASGFHLLRLAPESQSVALLRPGMRLDMGGIGQGFAADEALAVLKKLGLPRALVDVSGDIALGDAPPGEQGWKIGVAALEPAAPPSRVLRLANQAISTSGDAFQFVEIDGVRYSHIVDPRTGLGLSHRSGVTVIAPNCTIADCLATAVCVVGPERGLELVARTPAASALIVVERDGRVRTVGSPAFPEK